MENIFISFSGKLAFKEFNKARNYQLRTIFWCLCLLMFVFDFLNFVRNIPWIIALIYSLIYTIGFVILAKILKIILYSIQYKTESLFKNERHFSIDDDGIYISTKNSKLFYGWSEFRSVHELKKIYLLNLSAVRAIIISKRFFNNEEDVKTFKRFVSDKIIFA